MNFIEGEILYIDKPLHWTSFDVVKRVRGALLRRLHQKKLRVGHAGTLDPLATGVVIVVTGRATKKIESLQEGVKAYEARIQLGATTPSFDLETEIDHRFPTDHIDTDLIEHVLKKFRGEIFQVPPAFSACKIQGRRAYDMARNGEEVKLAPKLLQIDDIKLLNYDHEAQIITLDITCSKGTYIRALARDIGISLGSGAHLIGLKRTRVGDVTLDQCLSIEQAIFMIAHTPVEIEEIA